MITMRQIIGRRPNNYGYVLIVGGLLTTIIIVLSLRSGAMPWYPVLFWAPMLLLNVPGWVQAHQGRTEGSC
jgi:hypothetical protein